MSKCTFENSPHNYVNAFSSQFTKPLPTRTHTQIFVELVPSISPLLKEHIKLGRSGIVDHSLWFVNTRFKFFFFYIFFKGMARNNCQKQEKRRIKIIIIIYKCIMANTSAIWQQASHTTYQLPFPSCSTRAIQKSLTSYFFRKKVRRIDH